MPPISIGAQLTRRFYAGYFGNQGDSRLSTHNYEASALNGKSSSVKDILYVCFDYEIERQKEALERLQN
jgi:hypothetical protein